MRWLLLVLALQWSCLIDARGLAIDYKQAVGEDTVAKADTEDISGDNRSDISDTHNMNFIYQFLTGNPTGMFEEIK